MDWLKNWDDLIHGTAVFSAAVPFFLAFALTFKVPARFWWALVVLAMVPAVYWLFPLPKFPPKSSDHMVAVGLLAAVALFALELVVSKWCFKLPLRLVSRLFVFVAIGWSSYPAWLSTDGGIGRKWLVCGGLGVAIALWSVAIEFLAERATAEGRRFSVTPAAFIPPTIALAVLLQTGGMIRFGQVAGALAAALAAICLAMVFRRKRARADGENDPGGEQGKVAALWGILFVLLGCSGWLFAEIRYALAGLLLCAPLLAAFGRLVPYLPRKNVFLCLLWDFLASAMLAIPVAAVAALEYAAEMEEFEGY